MIRQYAVRFVTLICGLMFCALGSYFVVSAANIGIGAWETFHLGLSRTTGIAYGDCAVITSVAIIVIDFLLKGKIGFGTVLNGVLIGKFTGFIMAHMDFLPPAQSLPVGIVYILTGQFLLGCGGVIYMSRAMGCGPRDTLMVVIGQRFPNAPIGLVRFFMDLGVFVIGVLMGGPFGFGTLVAMGMNSTVMQTVYKITSFEPRKVRHEDIPYTLGVWSGKNKSLFTGKIANR